MAALILKRLRKKPLINDGVKVLFAFHLLCVDALFTYLITYLNTEKGFR